MNVTFDSEAELEIFICDNFIDNIITSVLDPEWEHMGHHTQIGFGSYGRPDIVIECAKKVGEKEWIQGIIIAEIKNVKITAKDFAQISRYMTCLNRDTTLSEDTRVLGVLIGPEGIDDSCLILNFTENISLLNVSFEENKFTISESPGWYRNNEGWSLKDAIIKFQEEE